MSLIPRSFTEPAIRLGRAAQNALEVARFGGLETDEEPTPFEVVERHRMYKLRRYGVTEASAPIAGSASDRSERRSAVLLVPTDDAGGRRVGRLGGHERGRPARRCGDRAVGDRLWRPRTRGGRPGADPHRPRRGAQPGRRRGRRPHRRAGAPRRLQPGRHVLLPGRRLPPGRGPGRASSPSAARSTPTAPCRSASTSRPSIDAVDFLADNVLKPPRRPEPWASRAGFRMMDPAPVGDPAGRVHPAAPQP